MSRAKKHVLSKLALGPFGAKAGNIVLARLVPNVAVPALGTVFAEAAGVPWTIMLKLFRLEVEKETVVIAAGSVGCEEVTWRHLTQIVFV